jgi:hypothetical protein
MQSEPFAVTVDVRASARELARERLLSRVSQSTVFAVSSPRGPHGHPLVLPPGFEVGATRE